MCVGLFGVLVFRCSFSVPNRFAIILLKRAGCFTLIDCGMAVMWLSVYCVSSFGLSVIDYKA